MNKEVFIGLIIIVLTIIITRWLGAWMLRINDVINILKEIKIEIKELNEKEL